MKKIRRFGFALDTEEEEALEIQAERQGVSRAAYLRKLIRDSVIHNERCNDHCRPDLSNPCSCMNVNVDCWKENLK